MKTLILFRHGKPDRSVEPDFDRPLTERGMEDAATMGKALAGSGTIPDRLISSPALRARTTAELAIKSGKWNAECILHDALYESDPITVLDIIQSEPDCTRVLMMVGHEPVWTETARQFIGDCNFDFPAAGMLRIDFDVNRWADVAFKNGILRWLLTPELFCRLECE